jgi:hypothetical protein
MILNTALESRLVVIVLFPTTVAAATMPSGSGTTYSPGHMPSFKPLSESASLRAAFSLPATAAPRYLL